MALAAIQGLHQLVVEENRALRRDREQLLERLAALEAIVQGLATD